MAECIDVLGRSVRVKKTHKNPKMRSPTELIMDPFEEGGVLRVRVV